MSEIVVAKAGGTSNADAAAVEKSLEWAEQSDIFVVSAPGKLEGDGLQSDKVTNLLLQAYKSYRISGDVPVEIADIITGRYADIVHGLGRTTLPAQWIDNIGTRIDESVRRGEDYASMLGERLQAEVIASKGFKLLSPEFSPDDLGHDPDNWGNWLGNTFQRGSRYVLPGNTTLINNRPATFDRGGSDISGGLAAYAVQADLHINLTDGCAQSADPRLITSGETRPIRHMLYVEGRELGRNGTGLLHPAAMLPLMRGNIPTQIRSTFDVTQPVTLLDNDQSRAADRSGQVIALSLMKNVSIYQIHEPGMAEATGRLAAYDTALGDYGVPIVDSQGDGVDGQKYFIEAKHDKLARQALEAVVWNDGRSGGTIERKENVDLITLVGYDMQRKKIDHLVGLIFNSGLDAKQWQYGQHDMSMGRHSLRVSVDRHKSLRVFERLHEHYIENPMFQARPAVEV